MWLGAPPVGAAPTTSSLSIWHLAPIYCTKTTASAWRDDKNLSFEIFKFWDLVRLILEILRYLKKKMSCRSMATPSRGRGGQTRGRGRGRSGYNTSYSSRGASANDNIDDLTRQFGGLNTGPQTSGQSYSRLARGSRPAYRAKSRGGPRPWPGPRKQSAFVFFFLGEKLYVMRNITNELGTPGGVRWDEDDSLVVTIKRKFSHEVGKEIPKGEFR